MRGRRKLAHTSAVTSTIVADPIQPRSWLLVLATLLSLGVAAIVSFRGMLQIAMGSCGRDGISPDSPQGVLCQAIGGPAAAAWIGLAFAMLAAILVYRLMAARRTGTKKRIWPWLILTPAVPLVLTLAIGLPADSCSGADQAAFDAWAMAGNGVTPPADCR